jgi:uncharacterized membrane protein
MEAFSDGVVAIAATLLVLDLALRPPGSPLTQFLRAWPSYLAYVVSFLTIGAAWIVHNALTDRIDRADSILLRLNLLYLMLVAFLPYPTRLVADSLSHDVAEERVAAVVYGITLLAIRLLFVVMDRYSQRAHLLVAGATDSDLQDERSKLRVVIVGYVVTIAIAVALPAVAIALYFGMAIYLVTPFAEVARTMRRTRPD